MRTRSEVERELSLRRAELEKVRAKLTEARKVELDAEAEYVESGRKAHLERKRDAVDERERLEKLERRAEGKVEEVEVEIAQLDAEDMRQQLEQRRDTLSSFADAVLRSALEFVRLDREIENQVFAVAAQMKNMGVVHDEAVALATELRIPSIERTIGARPDLANVCLAVRRVVSDARKKEQRDPLGPYWLSDSPDARDWRLAGMNSQEIEDTQRHAANLRAQEAKRDAVVEAIARVDDPRAQLDTAVRLVQDFAATRPPAAPAPITDTTHTTPTEQQS